jgi:hypothetical protein
MGCDALYRGHHRACGKVVRRLSCRWTRAARVRRSAAYVQVSLKPQGRGNGIERIPGLQLVQKPEPLLCERTEAGPRLRECSGAGKQRRQIAEVRLVGPASISAASAASVFASNILRRGRSVPNAALRARHGLRRKQRVAAAGEEAVLSADRSAVQNVFPDVRQSNFCCSPRGVKGRWLRCPAGAGHCGPACHCRSTAIRAAR